jgi:hypothetical protein
MKAFLIFILSASLSGIAFSSSFRGFVYDKDNGRGMSGVTVAVTGTNYRTSTNAQGFFLIDNLPAGTFSIIISYLRHSSLTDSIYFSDNSVTIERTYWLESDFIPVNTSFETENYQRYLAAFIPDSLLEITLDSLKEVNIKESLIVIYSTFRNKTDSAIYVFRDTACLRMADIYILNNNHEVMKRNSAFIDCVGMKSSIDSSDFLRIEAHSKMKYPPVYTYFNNFKRYPADEYYILVEYRYFLPAKTRKIRPYSESNKYKSDRLNYYLGKALRGKFMSINFLKYNNSHLIK